MPASGRQRTTIYDVAKAAGVSVATVSRAVNGLGEISESTRSHVFRVVEELGYVPSFAARALAINQTKAIAAILTVNSGSFSWILRAAEHTASSAGFSTLLVNTHDSYERELSAVKTVLGRQIDGLLLTPSEEDRAPAYLLQEAGIPFVLLFRRLKGIACDIVGVDNPGLGRKATTHLLELGHRRIAIITGPKTISTVRARLKGYHQAHQEFDVPVERQLILSGSFSAEFAYESMRSLAERNLLPSAVVASNTSQAIGVYRMARDFGLSVPSDLAVIGADEIANEDPAEYSAAAFLDPPLTTMHVDYWQAGTIATTLLLARIADASRPFEHHWLEPTLIPRRSSTG